jgi:SPX domain protein involved in polyphosphate accumulation
MDYSGDNAQIFHEHSHSLDHSTQSWSKVQKASLGEFNRIEDKYVADRAVLAPILSELSSHLDPGYPNPETKFTNIESLYFDGPDLVFYQHHIQRLQQRSKLRIRRYGPNGKWDDKSAFIELKTKVVLDDGKKISKKKRLKISNQLFEHLKQGGRLTPSSELRGLNINLSEKKILKRINVINSLVDHYGLGPRVSVTYKRNAFEKGSLRITVDNNLLTKVYEPVKRPDHRLLEQKEIFEMNQKRRVNYHRSKNMIVEIKHDGSIPEWTQKMISDLDIRPVSFSKYCWSISGLLDQAQQDVLNV